MKSIFWILFAIYTFTFIFISCTSKNIENERQCPSFSIMLLRNTNKANEEIIRTKKLEQIDSVLVYEILKITDLIDSIAIENINESGGLAENGNLLFPCKKGERSLEIIEKSGIDQRILNLFIQLKLNPKFKSEEQLNLIQNTERLFSYYFNPKEIHYSFSPEYIKSQRYAQICLDLYSLNNVIFMYLHKFIQTE